MKACSVAYQRSAQCVARIPRVEQRDALRRALRGPWPATAGMDRDWHGGRVALLLLGALVVVVGVFTLPTAVAQPSQGAKMEVAPATKDQRTASLPSHAVRLRTVAIHDPGINNIEAVRLFVPADWKVEGGVRWMHDRVNLATLALRVSSPDGMTALEFLPFSAHVWQDGGIPYFNVGMNYLGSIVTLVIADPAAYVRQIVLPQHRSQVHAQVAGTQALPDVAHAVALAAQEPGMQIAAQAARVRIAYAHGGRQFEEDIYCALLLSRAPATPRLTHWQPNQLFAFRAEAGSLDTLAPLLKSMAASLRINPHWFSAYLHVSDLFIKRQLQGIRNAGELSRYIARASEQISAAHREAWRAQQTSQDRISANFSRYIRGVESYQYPFEARAIELPSGYRQSWAAPGGDYILSNNANFNPNVGGTRDWRILERVR